MFANLFEIILNGLRSFSSDVNNYVRCRSICCNNVNIYNPNSCCVQREIFNKWVRATTPSAESPIRRDKTEKFYTPKNS